MRSLHKKDGRGEPRKRKEKFYLDTYPVGVYYQTVEMRSKKGDFT